MDHLSKLYQKTEKHQLYKQREALIKIGQLNSARKLAQNVKQNKSGAKLATTLQNFNLSLKFE